MADIVRAGEALVGYVSLEEGVGCGVGSSGTPVTINFPPQNKFRYDHAP